MKEQISGVREVPGEVQQGEGQTWMMIRGGGKAGVGGRGRRGGGEGRGREEEGGAARQGRACLDSVWMTENDIQKHSAQYEYALRGARLGCWHQMQSEMTN